MTEQNKEYDRKKLIILRAALIVIGCALGVTAMWQYFVYYPHLMRREFQIVIIVVSGVFIALILGLSAKPFYRLIGSISELVGSGVSSLGAKAIIAIAVAFVCSGGLVFLLDFVIRMYLDIWAVRLLVDVMAYIIFAALLSYGFTRITFRGKGEKRQAAMPNLRAGYLISAKCFFDERVITAACTLINAKVCEGAYKAICLYGGDKAEQAIKRLDTLVKRGDMEVLRLVKDFESEAEYTELERKLATSKKLKYVSAENDNSEDNAVVGLSVFTAPSDELLNRYSAPQEETTDGETIVER